jgi:hypothetical protein
LILLLQLGACTGGGWTREAALGPLLVRLDAGGDGRVDAAEYERVAYAAPPFSEADADRDGALSVSELEVVLFRQDPNTFDGALTRTPPDLSLGPGVSGPVRTKERLLVELFGVLREEALAARPDALLPDPWRAQLAAATGRLDSAESRELLSDLERAWNVAAGLQFPPALSVAGRPASENPGPVRGGPAAPNPPPGPGGD